MRGSGRRDLYWSRGNAEEWAPFLIVAVIVLVAVAVAVAVIAPVVVAALVNGNDIVDVIDTVDDQGSTSFVSMATMRSSKSTPRSYSAFSISSSIFMTSRCAAHSIAEPLAIV